MQRRFVPEKMDDPHLTGTPLRRALRGIDRLHWLLGTFRGIAGRLRRRLPEGSGPLSVLDVGGGSGYLGVVLRDRLDRRIEYLRLEPEARMFEAVPPRGNERPVRGRGERLPLADGSVDVTVSSLLLHHLSDGKRGRLLRETMRVSRVFVLHHDLVRSRWHHWLARCVTGLLTPNPINRHDGPASVARSHTVEEWRRHLQRRGPEGYELVPAWPWRVNLVADLLQA